MKAKFIKESLDFERGLEPKSSIGIGREGHLIKKNFRDAYEAADWAIRNLELITNNEYSPNEMIRSEGYSKIPRKLTEYLMKWSSNVKLEDVRDDPDGILVGPFILAQFMTHLIKHGLLKENIDFERGNDPKDSLKIGKDRYKQPGDIEFGAHFLRRDPGTDPSIIIINTLNGKEYQVGLYAAKDVINALKELID